MTKLVISLLLLVGLTVTGHAQEFPAPGSSDTIILQSGDILQIRIWREPDLSGDFMIDETGKVTLPLLGSRHAAGVSIGELRDSLLSSYSQELRNPSIVIVPLRRVYVLGDVNSPGLKTVDPTVSLAGVVALAGGANPQGDLRKIRVIRDGVVLYPEISPDASLSDIDLRSGDQVHVGRRSWFDRNSTFVVSALLSITSIAISLVQ